ncbi:MULTISPECIES: NUDIX hydrolase [unclassified Curtobacterium]|uniref:NUDIX domain-containing protein n=1 Tax=unclassified Curtobacterium TaxID=257496 RepID=UPI0008DD6838|nr:MULTISPECIES: NUDIX hydrolase [unclassified Curtobacterium]OIH94142.1 ADP-ribose pyrophosphatase [Curtobacterium sp. MCBA15_003]OII29362.1 ADP-ribose pyrophosphatase [Curtobacterium sp. MMLR14_006]
MTDAPIADEPASFEVTESSVVYEGAVWDVRRDAIAYHDDSMVREYVDHTGAVAVYAEDDEGRVLVIQQYRHPVRVRDWELPAGLLDMEGEEHLTAAQRELAEEADLEADEWEPLVRYNTSSGGSNEFLQVYRARGVRPTATAFDREAEEADIVKRWVPRAELVAAILDGRLHNSGLVVAVLAVDALERRDA